MGSTGHIRSTKLELGDAEASQQSSRYDIFDMLLAFEAACVQLRNAWTSCNMFFFALSCHWNASSLHARSQLWERVQREGSSMEESRR